MRKAGNILIAKEACEKMKTKMKISSAIFRKKNQEEKFLGVSVQISCKNL